MALLEADVNFKVVKDFVAQVRERARRRGRHEARSRPGQTVVKIVLDELDRAHGRHRVASSCSPAARPNVIMLVGLQGSGKTTAAAKLANLLRKQGQAPAARRVRRLPPGRHRPARGARPRARRPGLPRRGHATPVAHRAATACKDADRQTARRRHRRHRRPPARRRGDDGRGRRDHATRCGPTRCSWSSTR